jgi:hypothetical protein
MNNKHKYLYRIFRKKLDTARIVQTIIPVNASRVIKVDQEDSQIQSTTIIGRKINQTMISTTEGKVCTQFQIEFSHSGFAISAIINPTHSTAKITMA